MHQEVLQLFTDEEQTQVLLTEILTIQLEEVHIAIEVTHHQEEVLVDRITEAIRLHDLLVAQIEVTHHQEVLVVQTTEVIVLLEAIGLQEIQIAIHHREVTEAIHHQEVQIEVIPVLDQEDNLKKDYK